jgi:hypothetical protein
MFKPLSDDNATKTPQSKQSPISKAVESTYTYIDHNILNIDVTRSSATTGSAKIIYTGGSTEEIKRYPP